MRKLETHIVCALFLALSTSACRTPESNESSSFDTSDHSSSVDLIKSARLNVFKPRALSTLNTAFVEPLSLPSGGIITLRTPMSKDELSAIGINVNSVSGSTATANFNLLEALRWTLLDEVQYISVSSPLSPNADSNLGSDHLNVMPATDASIWDIRNANFNKVRANLSSKIHDATDDAVSRAFSGFIHFEHSLDRAAVEAAVGFPISSVSGTRATFNNQTIASLLKASISPDIKYMDASSQLSPRPSIGVGNLGSAPSNDQEETEFPFLGCYTQTGSGTDGRYHGSIRVLCIVDTESTGTPNRHGRFEFNFGYNPSFRTSDYLIHANLSMNQPRCPGCYAFENLEVMMELMPMNEPEKHALTLKHKNDPADGMTWSFKLRRN